MHFSPQAVTVKAMQEESLDQPVQLEESIELTPKVRIVSLLYWQKREKKVGILTPNSQMKGASSDLSAATYQIFDETHTMGNALRWMVMKKYALTTQSFARSNMSSQFSAPLLNFVATRHHILQKI